MVVNTALAIVALSGQALLVTAVARRLAGPIPLRSTLASHDLLPARLRHPVIVVGLEAGQLLAGLAGAVAFVGGVGLNTYWVWTCAASAALYTGFTAYLAVLMRVRGRVSCGCLGQRDQVGAPSVVRAGVFAVASVLTAVAGLPDLAVPARLVGLGAAALIAGFAVYLVALADALAGSRATLEN